jgi:hypothetical protein
MHKKKIFNIHRVNTGQTVLSRGPNEAFKSIDYISDGNNRPSILDLFKKSGHVSVTESEFSSSSDMINASSVTLPTVHQAKIKIQNNKKPAQSSKDSIINDIKVNLFCQPKMMKAMD